MSQTGCFASIKLDLPPPEQLQLTKCPDTDFECQARQIKQMLAAVDKLLYLNPQVYDLNAKIQAVDCYRQALKQRKEKPLTASANPWGYIVAQASPENVVHFNPNIVIRQKEKEYDEFKPLGAVANAVDAAVSRFQTLVHIWLMFISTLIEVARGIVLPTPIAFRISEEGIEVAQCTQKDSYIVVHVETVDTTVPFNVPTTRYTCTYGDYTVLDYDVVEVTRLADSIVEIAKKIYPDLRYPEPRATVLGLIREQTATDALYLVQVWLTHTEWALTIAGHTIELPGTYVVTESGFRPVQIYIAELVKNVLSSISNITRSLVSAIKSVIVAASM